MLLQPYILRTSRPYPEGRQRIVIPETAQGINRPALRMRTTKGAPIHAGSLDPYRRWRTYALGWSMSQERPTSNLSTEHLGGSTHVFPSTLQPVGQAPCVLTKEASTILPTPNHYWRLFNDPGLAPQDPGLSPITSGLRPPVVTTEAFLGLTQQVRTLIGMIQAIVPCVPQLSQAPMHQHLHVPRQDPEITLGDGDDAYPDHDDALVISAQIANARVKRVMVDTGRFTGDSVSPAGTAVLPVTVGEEPRSKTLLVSFIVVALPSAYNAIIGRPTLNKLRAVVSTYHRIMKFPTRAGVGEVQSDPRESRQCYLTGTTLPKKLKASPPTHGVRDSSKASQKPEPTKK
ncbi:hypothetical protein GW17_00055480, partial [Ensete ventricosum]